MSTGKATSATSVARKVEHGAEAHAGQIGTAVQGAEAVGATAVQSAAGGSDDSNASDMISAVQNQASQEMAANDDMTTIGNQVSMEAAKNNLRTAMQDAENNTMKAVGSSIKSATAAG